MTVQVLAPPKLRLVGLHCKETKASGGNSVREAVCELPFRLAVITAVCEVLMVPAVAVKVAVLAPLATVTEAGTVTFELLSLNVTLVLVGAG